VDTREELRIKYLQMNRLAKLSTFGRANNTNVTLNIGRNPILTAPLGIRLIGTKWDRGIMHNRMSSMLSSGIYHQLKKMERSVVFRLNARFEANSYRPSPLNLNSNILTLFALYCCLLLISLLWLKFEWFCSSYPKLRYCGIRLFLVFSQVPATIRCPIVINIPMGCIKSNAFKFRIKTKQKPFALHHASQFSI